MSAAATHTPWRFRLDRGADAPMSPADASADDPALIASY